MDITLHKYFNIGDIKQVSRGKMKCISLNHYPLMYHSDKQSKIYINKKYHTLLMNSVSESGACFLAYSSFQIIPCVTRCALINIRAKAIRALSYTALTTLTLIILICFRRTLDIASGLINDIYIWTFINAFL